MAGRHIAFLITALGAGGAERVIAILARNWIARGDSVTILTFDADSDPVYHALPQQVQLHRMGMLDAKGFRGNMRKVAALRRAVEEVAPDVLVSFLTKNNLLAALACLGTDTPLVCSERNNPERQTTHPLWNVMLRWAYRRADAIVCQTEAVRRCFPASVQDRLAVIYNPIEAFARDPDAAQSRTICAVGRLTPQKDFQTLIRAFAMIAPKHEGWSLQIWGSGELRQKLQDLIEALAMQDQITLPGNTSMPGEWARSAAFFVMSSRYEGFGNALAEAVASGMPVISTDCDFGPAEIVTEGRSGLLVPVGDERAMADAISRMIEDRDLRRRCAIEGPRQAARFRTSAVVEQWAELIEGIARRPQSRLPADRVALATGTTR
ncbi:glycosyltransferase family 4 protein [Qipengyuania sp. 6B39]|uniref:glycosyltransferase family 4 protein n=1 Tax=Qipengyuania proteolytica TaxID=2867239 RepID=UPI001C8A3051|nr:glycosyltransferase family 4 protein [Qipengyuania proteolytica]MBX7495805.1 glycosyltransferase family 4 protein [Qipengyuania proteolytica]